MAFQCIQKLGSFVCVHSVGFLGLVEFGSLRQLVRNLSTSNPLFRHPGITHPHKLSRLWAVNRIMKSDEYTVDAVPLVRTGGRGPDGRIKYKHQTTGLRRPWFMVDYNYSRHIATGQIREELILKIAQNWWRTHHIALVASGEVKRWIVATENMRPGDVIVQHVDIPYIPVNPREGDAYPVGALPAGTTVCLVELRPGEGAIRCRAAGTSAMVVRRGKWVGDPNAPATDNSTSDITDEHVVMLRDGGTRKLFRLLPQCMVVVGRVSNCEHKSKKYSKFGEKYWHGIKQRSGLWQRKTGRFGRKLRPIGPPVDCISPKPSPSEMILKLTKPEDPEFCREKQRKKFSDMILGVHSPFQPTPKASNQLSDSNPRFVWSSWTSVR
ncbi:unnamed protein product [Dicrocoelium dendriticum]|nr:unnamed protein product [Dicrocoelium dendriticum]